MARGRQTLPSYHQGLAHGPGESAYPGSWKGLVGAWVMSFGPTGGTLRDVSGYKNHGTLQNMDLANDWAIGNNDRIPGYVLTFDESEGNNSVDMLGTDTGILAISGEITVSIWAKQATTATPQRMFTKYNTTSGNTDWIFTWWSDSLIYWTVSVDGVSDDLQISTTNTWSDTTIWHHFVAVYVPGTLMQIWVDGVLEKEETTSIPVSMNTGGGFVNMAKAVGDTNEFGGELNNGRIFNRALNVSEILQLWYIPLAPFILRDRLAVKAPAAVGVTVPDQTLAPTQSQMNSGGMVGQMWMKRNRVYVPERLHGE